MNSPKSLNHLIIFILIVTTGPFAPATSSTATKRARISNYKPGQSIFDLQLNRKPQVDSYSVPLKNANNSYGDLTGDERLDFLKAHNGVRQQSGLAPLVWDAKIAKYSSKYAAVRHDNCNMVHSFGQYGENIFWGSGTEWTPAEVVKLWVAEHRYYNRQTNKCKSGQMCGHYTQIVWRNTHRIGCAKIKCATGDTFAICNYDPPGNYVGEGPFDRNN